MKAAIVMTVKNEARLLKQNVCYHLGIGATKVFVYFDNTTDNGPQVIKDIKGVEISNSVKAETYSNIPALEKFWSNAEEHHTARQCLNTFDALQKCKEERIDWLISIDADELFLTSKDGAVSIEDFFSIAEIQNATIVNLKPLEVISRKVAYNNVMLEETLFKTQKNFASKLDQIYNKLYDPYKKENRIVSYWLGHTMGKSAIKVNSAVIPYNVHRYTSSYNEELIVVNSGYVLHYHIYDYEDFIKKFKNFKNHPDHFLSGNKIEDLKSLLITLVNDKNNSEAFLKTYFKENLLYHQNKLKKLYETRLFNILKRKESAVVEIDYPNKILTHLKNKL
ncbi:glycosyltransferase family 2 protein [Winogradskyella sp. SYSU M77433]|uniref:glycosyltransferase family 2 protein n=1 Tax=Winogradskyella sp. SYSU M77433 TaxID=3042722 RepID=UPI002481491D|nr:glycosyltransferase family 2 protein [Winogradskyella sp. SYSU M77433]MDH7912997.1 glycosyltransferase family 2 protein [Winogradskyella sp. SYSU M77433]